MDEFRWERFLRASDARTETYGKILEKYADKSREEAEYLAAKEMGWTQIEEFLAQCDGLPEEESDTCEPEDLRPDPATEGIHWVRDASGQIMHPLVRKVRTLGLTFRDEGRHLGLLGVGTHESMNDLDFKMHRIGIKLAGALNSLAYDADPDHGFIVANLKRALKTLHEALTLSDSLRISIPRAVEALIRLDQNLLTLREDILRLMNHYRP